MLTKATPTPVGIDLSRQAVRVAGPHLGLAVKAEGSPRLPPVWDRLVAKGSPVGDQLQAAEGEEWLLVSLTAWAPLIPTDKYRASCSVVVGATTVELTKLLGRFDRYLGYDGRHIAVAVSAPVGAKASLVISDQGKKVSLDLRTLQVSKDADSTAMMLAARLETVTYQPDKLEWKGGWADGRNVDEMKFGADLDAKASFFTPGSSEDGWAKPGRVWFHVKYRGTYRSTFHTAHPRLRSSHHQPGQDGLQSTP